jgi:AraC-like DNA-binding protein
LRAKDYLGRRLHDPELTLDEVARACAISLRYLHVLFQGEGERPAEYLRRRRLERARRLLSMRENDLSVTQAAEYCGFTSPSSFSRAFRCEFGISPRECRESVAS